MSLWYATPASTPPTSRWPKPCRPSPSGSGNRTRRSPMPRRTNGARNGGAGSWAWSSGCWLVAWPWRRWRDEGQMELRPRGLLLGDGRRDSAQVVAVVSQKRQTGSKIAVWITTATGQYPARGEIVSQTAHWQEQQE